MEGSPSPLISCKVFERETLALDFLRRLSPAGGESGACEDEVCQACRPQSIHPKVGIEVSTPVLIPVGHREVTVLRRV
jgi:hypothetical protein